MKTGHIFIWRGQGLMRIEASHGSELVLKNLQDGSYHSVTRRQVKAFKVRGIATKKTVQKVLEILATPSAIRLPANDNALGASPQDQIEAGRILNAYRREVRPRVSSGDLLQMAEVLRHFEELAATTFGNGELSSYYAVREAVVDEIAVILRISIAQSEQLLSNAFRNIVSAPQNWFTLQAAQAGRAAAAEAIAVSRAHLCGCDDISTVRDPRRLVA